MQHNYALVYDGKDWNLPQRDGILVCRHKPTRFARKEKLINHKIELLSDKFYEMIDTLSEVTIRKFTRFLDEQDVVPGTGRIIL